MRLLLLLHLLSAAWAEKTEPEAQPGIAIAQQLVETLPRLPNMIHSQMEGKPEEFREMISQMLGGGLISQLVVNPLGVAEKMGVRLSSLGINKSDVQKKMLPKSLNSNTFPLFPLTTGPPSTTEKLMYLDGVPIKDFDLFVRSRSLEDHFSTKKPPTTTTPIPSVNDIAAAVLSKIQTSHDQPQDDYARNLDVSVTGLSRLQQKNALLRRAPQSFEMPLVSAPASFVQDFDPEVSDVVTSLRTDKAMNVERIRQLQKVLQTFEQGLQTKELIVRRKQLQILQNELAEQRMKIEEQKRMEDDLRKKEQELEKQRETMEVQLRKQLNMWHNSFSSFEERNSLPMPLDLLELASGSPANVGKENVTHPVAANQLWPTALGPPLEDRNIRLPARKHAYSHEANDEYQFTSTCNCQKISLESMEGRWSVALVSKSLLENVEKKVESLIPRSRNHQLSCSRITISTPKMSLVAQDATILWEFRISGSSELLRLSGSALTMDHKSVRVQLQDDSNNIFSAPTCVLKHSQSSEYKYMLVSNGNGPCRDAALLVRNPNIFFDEENSDLIAYLKMKIAADELERLDIAPFADDCL